MAISVDVFGQEARRRALVIGNTAYTKKPSLPNAVNDAASVSGALEAIGFEVTKKSNLATKLQMEQEVDTFINSLAKNDVCFVFYAGHGLSFDGANYLVPVQAELTQQHHIKQRCLAVSYLKDGLNYSNAKLKVIVLDACRSEEILPAAARVRGGRSGMVAERAPRGMVGRPETAQQIRALRHARQCRRMVPG